jgi:hypothetical protein
VVSTRIPVYLSHSYRPEDREINRHFWDLFWNEGFAFTVDPRSGEQPSIAHLELMMQRSACFVAIAPYRPDDGRHRTPAHIVYEHDMAVRAKKPRLVVVESGAASLWFEGSPLTVFQRDDLAAAPNLERLMMELRRQSAIGSGALGRIVGSVGLVLPRNPVYAAARSVIYEVLESAGYQVRELTFNRSRAPDFSEIDKHDFFVIDVGARGMATGLYYRFVPTIRLAHQSTARNMALVEAGDDNLIRWGSPNDLAAQLQPVVDKIERPRREFRSHEEGVGYFRSLGRALQGPVFISNAMPQNDLALDLSRALDLNNIRYFHYRYNNSIPMGSAWEGQLLQRIRSSRLFVALVSADYFNSPVCRQEFQLAQQLASQGQMRIYKYFLDESSTGAPAIDLLQGRDLAGQLREYQTASIVGDIDSYLTLGEGLATIVDMPRDHEQLQRSLLDQWDRPDLADHVEACAECSTLVAKLRRLEALAPAIRKPRPGLLNEVLARTRARQLSVRSSEDEVATS